MICAENVSKNKVFTNHSTVEKSQPKTVKFNLKENQIHPRGSAESHETNDTKTKTNNI